MKDSVEELKKMEQNLFSASHNWLAKRYPDKATEKNPDSRSSQSKTKIGNKAGKSASLITRLINETAPIHRKSHA